MSRATISIPNRWDQGAFQLKEFVEQYAKRHGVQFEVVLSPQLDANRMYLTDDTLTALERQVCENAISAVSDYLNHVDTGIWRARHKLTEEHARQLKEISDLIDGELPPNI